MSETKQAAANVAFLRLKESEMSSYLELSWKFEYWQTTKAHRMVGVRLLHLLYFFAHNAEFGEVSNVRPCSK